MLLYSTAALLLGAALDALFGDPRGIPHIIVCMGRTIEVLERRLRALFPKTPAGERAAGRLLVFCMLLLFTLPPLVLLIVCYRLSGRLGMLVEALFCWQLLAMKDLGQESMAVAARLEAGDLPGARQAVAMIVGRDTDLLDAAGVTRATVETVAENASDGVIAPLFYLTLGGAPLGCLYKAVNTMDSMIGYRNERYLHFGRMAARLDDVLNFLPARLAAGLMLLVCRPLGLDSAGAKRIYRRDRRRHDSPNSAHTEAVCAGALGIRLAGDAVYSGVLHKKPGIGDALRPIETADIARANRLMRGAATAMLLLSVLLRTAVLAACLLF